MPYLRPVDISGKQEDFSSALTDNGVCVVYNGNSLTSTYRDSARVADLAAAIDSRGKVVPKKINGTGHMYEKTFWLNLADRSEM